MHHVVACIDGSASAPAVCDYAAWACPRLGASLTLLHVLEQQHPQIEADLSGNIWLRSRDSLLQEAAALEVQRKKQSIEHAQVALGAARERVIKDGIDRFLVHQLDGDLLERLHEFDDCSSLLVLGKQGATSNNLQQHIGGHLESVVRKLPLPILVTPVGFKVPQSAMLAFDGSLSAHKALATLVASPLCKGLPIHLVMIGKKTDENWSQLEAACKVLQKSDFAVYKAILPGPVEPALHSYQVEHGVDLLVMGAYGHSRIHQLLLGSTTSGMLRITITPLLLLH